MRNKNKIYNLSFAEKLYERTRPIEIIGDAQGREVYRIFKMFRRFSDSPVFPSVLYSFSCLLYL